MAIPDPATTEWVPLWDTKGSSPSLHAATHIQGGADPISGPLEIPRLYLSSTAPSLNFSENDQPANNKHWQMNPNGPDFVITPLDDFYSGNPTLIIKRSGDVEVYRGLTVNQGLTVSSGNISSLSLSSADIKYNNTILGIGSNNHIIGNDTVDGADNSATYISGSKILDVTRGAFVAVTGNEHAGAGCINLVAGDAGAGTINFFTGPTTRRLQIYRTGGISIGNASADPGIDNLFVTGHIRERARATALGDWINYTPDWINGSGTANTIGNGTLSGRYSLVGNIVFFQISLFIGTTTNIIAGDNVWNFGLPLAVNNQISVNIGTAFAHGAIYTGGIACHGNWFTGPGANRVTVVFGNNLVLKQSVPFAWGANNYLFIEGRYGL